MEEYTTGLSQIKTLLAAHPEGLSIHDIANQVQANRNSIAKYMDILQIQGAVDGRKVGTSKVYSLSERLPVTSIRKFCTRPLLIFDHLGIVIDINTAFSEITGQSPDKILKQPFDSQFIQFLDGNTSEQVQRNALWGQEQRVRAQIIKGSEIIPVMLLFEPVVFENGKPGASVIIENTSGSFPHPDKNSSSRDLHTLLDDQIGYIIQKTPEGIIRYVNDRYCHDVGRVRESLIGRPYKPLVSAEDAEKLRIHITRLTPRYPVGTIEYRVVMADGEVRYQRWEDHAIFNERKELILINSSGIDITEQVLAKQNLKKMLETLEESIVNRTEDLRSINRQLYDEIAQREKAEQLLLRTQFAMDNAADMIFWISENARVQYANAIASQLLGFSATELLEHSFDELFPEYTPAAWNRLWKEIKQAESLTIQTNIARRDHSRFPVEISFRFLAFHGDECAYCFSRDISDRTMMERALKQANRRLNLSSSVTRHDIQNKITVLLGFLARTRKKTTDPDILNYLNHQEKAAKAIRNEIQFTREFKDLGITPPLWLNVREVASRSIDRHRESAIRFEAELPDIEVYADKHFERVFDKIFENIHQYGKNVSEIRIYLEQKNNTLKIIVEDNGSGVPVKDKEQIFSLITGEDWHTGLFIAREILSLTDILLTETGRTGKGARFEIQIPPSHYRIPNDGQFM
jgi:PAS domain S-box-containing protein